MQNLHMSQIDWEQTVSCLSNLLRTSYNWCLNWGKYLFLENNQMQMDNYKMDGDRPIYNFLRTEDNLKEVSNIQRTLWCSLWGGFLHPLGSLVLLFADHAAVSASNTFGMHESNSHLASRHLDLPKQTELIHKWTKILLLPIQPPLLSLNNFSFMKDFFA